MAPADNNGEVARLAAIRRYGVIDDRAGKGIPRIVRLTQRIYRSAMASFNVVDQDRQVFLGAQGTDLECSSLDASICRYTIREQAPLAIPDTSLDPRTCRNELVAGPPGIAAYLGAPVHVGEGVAVGALCVLDTVPRPDFTPRAGEALVECAAILSDLLETRMRARVDDLTGLATRGHFLTELAIEIERRRRSGQPLSLILLDLDHFKQINDRHGHATGDAVLAQVGARLQAERRIADTAGRVGGEEFAVLLPDTPLEGALQMARRLSRAVAMQPVPSPAGALDLTVSIGVATAPGVSDTGKTLMRAADAALYRAKAAGRNCIRIARGQLPDALRDAG